MKKINEILKLNTPKSVLILILAIFILIAVYHGYKQILSQRISKRISDGLVSEGFFSDKKPMEIATLKEFLYNKLMRKSLFDLYNESGRSISSWSEYYIQIVNE